MFSIIDCTSLSPQVKLSLFSYSTWTELSAYFITLILFDFDEVNFLEHVLYVPTYYLLVSKWKSEQAVPVM